MYKPIDDGLESRETKWCEEIKSAIRPTETEVPREISSLVTNALTRILDGDYISLERPMFLRTKSITGLCIPELDLISSKLGTLNINIKSLPSSKTRLSLTNIAELFSQLVVLSELAYDKTSSYELRKRQIFNVAIAEPKKFDKILGVIMRKVRNACQPYLYGYYFHGSVASQTMTGFSDVDTLAIISKETLTCPEKLLNLFYLAPTLAKQLSRRDWLQHHGNYWMTEFDLSHFNSAILPICVLEEACTVCGPAHLEVDAVFETASSARTLWASIEWIRRHQAVTSSSSITNMYWLKHFLGAIMLIPSLVLQINGIWVSKGRSFGLAKDYYSPNAWKVIEASTRLRSCWSDYVSDLERAFFEKVVSVVLASRWEFEQTVARLGPKIPNNLRASGILCEIEAEMPQFLHESLFQLHNWTVNC